MSPPGVIAFLGASLCMLGEWLGGRLWMLHLSIGGVHREFKKKRIAPMPWYARLLNGLGTGLMLVALALVIKGCVTD